MDGNYVNLKMRTGEDLVAELIGKGDGYVQIKKPLHILVHPHHGFFVKSWNIFSEGEVIKIKESDYIWCELANEKAIECYEEFLQQMNTDGEYRSQTVDEFHDEVEETLEAMWDSKLHTKH